MDGGCFLTNLTAGNFMGKDGGMDKTTGRETNESNDRSLNPLIEMRGQKRSAKKRKPFS